jgi:hypothetical protein
MFRVEITSIRPNVNCEFFRHDHDLYNYIDENFNQTGKLVGEKITISDDRTTEVQEMIFASKADWIEFCIDPILKYHKRFKAKYNLFHKIAVSMNADNIVITRDLYNLYLR